MTFSIEGVGFIYSLSILFFLDQDIAGRSDDIVPPLTDEASEESENVWLYSHEIFILMQNLLKFAGVCMHIFFLFSFASIILQNDICCH